MRVALRGAARSRLGSPVRDYWGWAVERAVLALPPRRQTRQRLQRLLTLLTKNNASCRPKKEDDYRTHGRVAPPAARRADSTNDDQHRIRNNAHIVILTCLAFPCFFVRSQPRPDDSEIDRFVLGGERPHTHPDAEEGNMAC